MSVIKEPKKWYIKLFTLGKNFSSRTFSDNTKKFLLNAVGLFIVVTFTFYVESVGDDYENRQKYLYISKSILAELYFISEYTDVYISGDYVIVETAGVPNHASPYWGAGHPNYIAPHSGMTVNPNSISEQNFKFYIPLNPSVSSAVSSTPLGPIGVSISGVPFFNQYAGPNNQPLDNEIPSFDNYYGHPQQTGQYHYHWEPTYLTFNNSSSMLIGYSLDGFTIYGPTEQATGQFPSDLDELNGHSHSTKE